MLRILHFATDDKFVDMAITVFSKVPNVENKLAVFSPYKPKYVKSKIDFLYTRSTLKSSFEIVKSYDVLVFHSLNQVWYRLINSLPSNIKVVWFGWGYDYYDLLQSEVELHLPLTKKYLSKKISYKVKLRTYLKGIYYGSYLKKHIIERMTLFCPVVEQEYYAVKEIFGGNRKLFPRYASWNYGSLEENYLKNLDNTVCDGPNILIGNSATPTNNHADLLHVLKQVNLNGRKRIIPLSYGFPEYGKFVKEKFKDEFPLHCEFLLEYMPYDDYLSKIKSCSFVIMNHIRQQGVANIIVMLYLGAKVFLNEKSCVYKSLQKQGITLFTINELLQNGQLLNKPLSDIEMDKNRDIIRKAWSKEANYIKTSSLIDSLIHWDKNA